MTRGCAGESASHSDGRLIWRFDATGLARQAKAGIAANGNCGPRSTQICVPTLLVRGEHSPPFSQDQTGRVVQRLRHRRLVDIPGGRTTSVCPNLRPSPRPAWKAFVPDTKPGRVVLAPLVRR